MKLHPILLLFVLLVLTPLAGAQTNSGGPAVPAVVIPPRRTPTTGVQTQPAPNGSAAPLEPTTAFPPESPVAPSPGAGVTPARATPARPAPEPANISYEIKMPVAEVIGLYSKLVGRTALEGDAPGYAVNMAAPVTLKTESPLTHSEAVLALETVLGMNGVTVVPVGDKFFKIVSEGGVSQSGGTIYTNNDPNLLPDSGRFITEIYQLKYADPAQVVEALHYFARTQNGIIYIPSTQSLILRDYTENVKRMLEMLAKIDVSSPLVIKPKIINIKYALASDIASALSQLGAGGGSSVGRSSTGAGGRAFGSSGTGSTGTGGIGGGSTPGGAPYGTPQQSGLSAGAGGARSSTFQNNLRGIVAGAGGSGAGGFGLFGQTKIIADERTNSLLVFANDDDMKMIEDIIAKLDVVLAQVLIEAIILEVNLTDSKTTGISYLINKQTSGKFTGAGGVQNLSSASQSFLSSGSATGTNGTGTGGSSIGNAALANLPGGFSYFASWGNDLNVVLEAIATDSRVNVLSRPRIQTSHAVEAELFIGNTVPYVTGTQNYGYASGPSSTYTEKEVGIRLRVLPLINPDGLVVMDIDQEIEQLGAPVAIPGAGNVPTTTKRDAGAKVAVKSGDTVILGGFISATREKTLSGVPWLMDLPGIGGLFRSTDYQNQRTELIVLMRPTVLPTPEIAAKVATTERNKMAGVKQAEVEIRRDEDLRNQAAAKALAEEEAREAKRAQKTGATNTAIDRELGLTNNPSAMSMTNSPAGTDKK